MKIVTSEQMRRIEARSEATEAQLDSLAEEFAASLAQTTLQTRIALAATGDDPPAWGPVLLAGQMGICLLLRWRREDQRRLAWRRAAPHLAGGAGGDPRHRSAFQLRECRLGHHVWIVAV